MDKKYFVGVDVGTESVRAALVDENGNFLKKSSNCININNPEANHFEQSSDNIWNACCLSVKSVVTSIPAHMIKGIGFDATCSLVVLDSEFNPMSISNEIDNKRADKTIWNIIMWMDHRASNEADNINEMNLELLKYVGGKISLEMQMPKLLWLKNNLPDTWNKASFFLDLPDFLTFKATGKLSKSVCSLSCKWNLEYDAEENIFRWNDNFFEKIGLTEFVCEKYSRIGGEILFPGQFCGNLTKEMCDMMTLSDTTMVSASIVDAHAGTIGSLSCQVPQFSEIPLRNRMALICGTSSCHMVLTEKPVFVSGIWGPYYGVIMKDHWLLEGGQSATGKLIENTIRTHSKYQILYDNAYQENKNIYEFLDDILKNIMTNSNCLSLSELTRHLHIYPDYHGNRSPLANSSLRGMISGLSLDFDDLNGLALIYLATVQSLAYSTRYILEHLEKHEIQIKLIHICGGLSHNKLFVQMHSDITGLNLVIPDIDDSVLLGSSILGAVSSGFYKDIHLAMTQMGGTGTIIEPNQHDKAFHDKKYAVFLKMLNDQISYQVLMS